MANIKSIELAAVAGTAPQQQPDSAIVSGKVRRLRASYALAAQAIGDTLEIGDLPEGASVVAGAITSSVSLATSTLEVGVAGTTGKYRTAATHATADQPVLFGNAAAKDDPALAAGETLIATVGVAALPAAGILVIDILYTTRA